MNEELRQREGGSNLGPCPDPLVWYSVAAGSEDDSCRAYLSHAAECSICGKELENAIGSLRTEASAEEERELALLSSADPVSQSTIARELAATPTIPRRWALSSFFRKKKLWIPALATVASLVAVGLFEFIQARDLDYLVRAAYSEHRVLESRLSGAAYAPMAPEIRGENNSALGRKKLLQAELALTDRSPDKDPNALADLGRIQLLRLQPTEAIGSLKRALDQLPNSAAIMNDLGAAYFERARFTGHPEDYGAAVESFSKVLRLAPDDSVALYNRALSYQRLMLYDASEADWQQYLKVHGNEDWALSARQQLSEVQTLKKKL